MSHAALAKSGGGHKTVPNAWFVGMAPRRNPDIVVAVLWENGDWGWHSAQLAAQVIDAYVNKQRKRDGNLRIAETPGPATGPAPNPQAVPASPAAPAPPTASAISAAAFGPAARPPSPINRP